MTSRTSKSIINAKLAMLFFLFNLIITFVFRKVFIECLGAELLGLNSTIVSILNLLNMTELGINTAIAFFLYKPLNDNKHEEINKFIYIQGRLYCKVAYVIILLSLFLLCFFPWIFSKITIARWVPYATFGVMLFSSLLGYFVNYKQILLEADQRSYLSKIIVQGITFIKSLLQIVAIIYLPNGYIYWLILEFCAAIAIAYLLDWRVKCYYPYLRFKIKDIAVIPKEVEKVVFEKIKQTFVHKIGYVVTNQIPILFIYAFLSLSDITIYSNYQVLVLGLLSLLAALFSNIEAGIGNLVASSSACHIYDVFLEIFSLRFFIASIFSFGFYMFSSLFVKVWIGDAYLLNEQSISIFSLWILFNYLRDIPNYFLRAYGLVQDVWATLVEIGMNLLLSGVFGYYWGVKGILFGAFFSTFCIGIIWRMYFLFTCGLKINAKVYLGILFRYAIILITTVLISLCVKRYCFPVDVTLGISIFRNMIVVFVFSVVICAMLLVADKGMQYFFFRVKKIICHEN